MNWLNSLTIKGSITVLVVSAISFAFVYIIIKYPLPQDVLNMIVGGVMTMGGTIVGVWFGTQSTTRREEPPPVEPPELPKPPIP